MKNVNFVVEFPDAKEVSWRLWLFMKLFKLACWAGDMGDVSWDFPKSHLTQRATDLVCSTCGGKQFMRVLLCDDCNAIIMPPSR